MIRPIEVGIWKLGERIRRVEFSHIDSERRLEDILARDLSILSSGLMLIGRQVKTAYDKYIDMLAMNADGDLTVIELKKDRTPREVVAQLLDYGSWVQNLSYEEIAETYREKCGRAFEEGFEDRFGQSPPEKLNRSHQLMVVSAELDPSTERIISYLTRNYNVPINAVFFRYFKEGDAEYLTRSWLIDPTEIGVVEKGTETWNKRDYYVSFGVDDNRNWEDALKYGFVSAGGGKWYIQTLYNLEPANRVFVNIPKTGYVGVGLVTERAVPARDFCVDVNGARLPILKAPRNAKYHEKLIDDDDMCEHFVRVKWIRTIPEEQAIWEKGMFANQASACKLRNRFTLERLTAKFNLDD